MTDSTIEPGADPGTVPNRHVHPDPAPDRETAERRRRAVLAGHGGDAEAARSLAIDPEAVVRAAALGALGAALSAAARTRLSFVLMRS